jgi:hypothetical protein
MLAANGSMLSRLRSFWTWLSGFQRAALQRNTCDGYSGGGAWSCTVVGIPTMLLCCFACRIWAPMSRDIDDRDEKKLELSTRVLT